MATRNDNSDASAVRSHTTGESTRPDHDGGEAADKNSTETDEHKPPNHGLPPHGVARFLYEVDPDTPLRELAGRYREWQEREN